MTAQDARSRLSKEGEMRLNIAGLVLLLAPALVFDAGCGTHGSSPCGEGACCQLDADPEKCDSFDFGEDFDWGEGRGEGFATADPAVLALAPGVVTGVPVVWIASTDENMVAQFDSSTGDEVLRVPTYGESPSRTAVGPDGSVWVGNRTSNDYIHIGVDGLPLCVTEKVEGIARAVVIDTIDRGEERTQNRSLQPGLSLERPVPTAAHGFVWVGGYDGKKMYKVNPVPSETHKITKTWTDPATGQQATIEIPVCAILKEIPVSSPPYGAAIDGDGFLWTSTNGGLSSAKINVNNDTLVFEPDPSAYDGQTGVFDPNLKSGCWNRYGITIGFDNNPWYANYGCGTIVKLDRDTGHVLVEADKNGVPMLNPRAMGVDRDGNIWVSENGTTLFSKFTQEGQYLLSVDVTECGGGSGTLGIGSDMGGFLWGVLQGAGQVVKFTPSGEIVGCYPQVVPGDPVKKLLAAPYTYSDLTGSSFQLVTSAIGVWRKIVDAQATVHWLGLFVAADEPPGTDVCTRVRASDTELGIEAAKWTPEYCAGFPYEFTALGLPDTRFLQVEVKLKSDDGYATPEVTGLSVAYTPIW